MKIFIIFQQAKVFHQGDREAEEKWKQNSFGFNAHIGGMHVKLTGSINEIAFMKFQCYSHQVDIEDPELSETFVENVELLYKNNGTDDDMDLFISKYGTQYMTKVK